VQNLARTKAVQYAWDRGQTLGIHGWVYGLHDGLIKDLQVTAAGRDAVDDIYQLHETKRGNRPNASTS
jgi:carbonic anhydrase